MPEDYRLKVKYVAQTMYSFNFCYVVLTEVWTLSKQQIYMYVNKGIMNPIHVHTQLEAIFQTQ